MYKSYDLRTADKRHGLMLDVNDADNDQYVLFTAYGSGKGVTNTDLMLIGMKIVAIACSRLEAEGMNRTQRDDKFRRIADETEKWAKDNGVELGKRTHGR